MENIEKVIYEETEKRLEIMESPDYEFPTKAGRGDFVGIVVSIAVSVVLIVLCMTGVID